MQQLSNLIAIEELDLQYNNIDHLELPQGSFQKLVSLKLSYNRIPPAQIAELSQLPKLKILDLASNDLCTLPSDMSFLPELEQLNLACNNFSSDSVLVSPSQLFVALSTIPKLKRLDLSRNKFTQFHVEDLENFGTPASETEDEPNGPFCYLEDLDYQFNQVREEEGLIAPA